jgi:hypothetical protein
MPAPSTSLVPKEEYWGFIQRDITPAQLTALAKNIVANDGKVVDDNLKKAVLSFLTGDLVALWSAYWVTMINTLGIGYTTSVDNKLHKTKLTEHLANNGNTTEFFLLWTLLFQFPFAESKHKEYKENGIVVNPCQILLEALVYLVFISKNTGDKSPFREAYLSAEEIVLVLMKSKSNDTYEIIKKVNTIYENRVNKFDYDTIKLQGHDSIIDNFSGRARLYFEKSGIIKFSSDNEKIVIQDWKHFSQCQNYLSFRKQGVKINIETEEIDRIHFFENAFSNDINPSDFFQKVNAFNDFIEESSVEVDEVKAVFNNLLIEGFHFTEEFVERFLLSAKAKPFIILSGISGVGKSLLSKALMQLLRNVNCRPIAVSPDWTDNSDMLGYFGADNKFIPGEFTNVILDASKNLHIPYFLVLDEMNLAKVEYYFAQVLSVMESRYYDPLTNSSQHYDYLFNLGVKKRLENSSLDFEKELANLKIPPNLVIVGTVNIDESTHPFSKKVLDRANVLEINVVDLMIGIDAMSSPATKTTILPSSKNFVGSITNLNELRKHWSLNFILQTKYDFSTHIKKWIEELNRFNEILKPHHLNFGLRMRDEVCIYLYHSALRNLNNATSNWDDTYLDHQLVQKILTRLEGEEGEIEDTILQLFKLCLNKSDQIVDHESIIDFTSFIDPNVKYLLTAQKLKSMLYNLVVYKKPMVSFWTS